MTIWRRDPDVDPSAAGMDAAVLDEMARTFVEETERGALFAGAQMAVYRGGRRVLDIGGGIARVSTGVPVTPETLFVIFSSTKGLVALAMWMLHERGAFDFDEPVVKYWPSFASVVPEKAQVTIRHVMSHRAGFPIGPAWLTPRYWGDREAIRRAMEELPLRWPPGEKNGYHALNFGWMVNELIQRLDPQGRDTGQFLADEVFRPLGIADIYVGLPDDAALEERVAWVYQPEVVATAAEATGVVTADAEAESAESERDDIVEAVVPPEREEQEYTTPELRNPFNRPEVHRMVIPAGGGIATARALAHVYAALALGGELDGVRVVSRGSLEAAIVPTTAPGEVDRVLQLPVRWGTGWHIGGLGVGSHRRCFGHGGAGGQIGFADLDRGLAFAFVTTGQLRPAEFTRWRTDLQSMAFRACQS